MKLIFCPVCTDIVRLFGSERFCKCGASWGFYTDDVKAIIGGKSIPIGFDNESFTSAIRNCPEQFSCKFTAFVIPKNAENIYRDRYMQ